MKRIFAVGILLLAVLLVFGCSLGGKAYHWKDETSCIQIETNDADLIDVLELVDYTKGSCPTSYKANKGCEYLNSAYDTSVTFYSKDSTASEMQDFCDLMDGELVN